MYVALRLYCDELHLDCINHFRGQVWQVHGNLLCTLEAMNPNFILDAKLLFQKSTEQQWMRLRNKVQLQLTSQIKALIKSKSGQEGFFKNISTVIN